MDREALINQLFDTMNASKRGMAERMHQFLKDSGLSSSQLELLTAVRHAQPITFGELAKLLRLTPGAVSQLVDGLESRHLVERHKDPNDRRVQSIRLTSTGDQQLADIDKRRQTSLRHIMDDLTTEELATWVRIQQKIITHFSDTTQK